MIEICEKKECTGCAACADTCGKNAIKMQLDEKGFFHPVIQEELCVDCGRCVNVCPALNVPVLSKSTSVYSYQNPNERIRFESTSGGFFSAIAEHVLHQGGIVCGAGYDDDMTLIHKFAEGKEDLKFLRRSKYVQSLAEGVYRQIRAQLESGRKVLFVGLPCQAAGLYSFLGKQYENLILVDLVCYGAPSPGLFKDWVTYLQGKYGKVVNVVFRDKTYGYATPNVRILFENGRYIENCRDANAYSHWYFRNLTVRESCFTCRFKTVARVSDITLGDLWTAWKYDESSDAGGATAVFAHTEKGRRICRCFCKGELDLDEIVRTDGRKLKECVKQSVKYDSFWEDYRKASFTELLDKYEPDSGRERMKYFIKGFMNKTGVSDYIFQKKKRKAVTSDGVRRK